MQLGRSGIQKWWQRDLLVLCLFIILGTAVYWNALDNPFCSLDDREYVEKNLNIRQIENIPRFFVDPRLSTRTPHFAGHYRPLVTTSYAVDYALGGLNPVGYHLVNLVFHVGTAFLVFLIVKAMSGSQRDGPVDRPEGLSLRLAAFAAGLIFLVHPFNSEAVNYITARSSVMSGFFYLLGFYWWVRFRSQNSEVRIQKSEFRSQKKSYLLPLTSYFYIASLLAFMAGMLSKEVLITLPVVLWMYDLYFNRAPSTFDLRPSTWFNWRAYIPYLPFVLVVVIPYLVIRASSFGGVLPHFKRDLWTQILTSLPVLVRHWAMFFLPRGLSVFHDVEIYREVTLTVLLSGLALLLYMGLSALLMRLRHAQWRAVSFFMVWFFIVFLPMTIIPLNQIFRESRAYLAIVSFAVPAGVIIGELGCRFRRISTGLIVLLIGVYSLITLQRNSVWGDELLLWKDAVENASHSAVPYAGLAEAYMRRGDTFLAFETAQKGLSVAPNNPYILVNLGDSYQLMGKIDQAIKEYQKAIIINPRDVIVWKEIAILYRQKGDIEKAEFYLRNAMKIQNNYPPFYYNLGKVLDAKGKFNEAVEAYKKAIRLYPEYFHARYDLAQSLERVGERSEAVNQYQEIIHLASHITDFQNLAFEQDKEVVEKIIKDTHQRLSQNRDYR